MFSTWCVLEQLDILNGCLSLELGPALPELWEKHRKLAAEEWPFVTKKYGLTPGDVTQQPAAPGS